ncbi:hypothetical protein ASPCADRAFT_510362 [Aspergillus carbonarius ITEM 5010]|uniref:Uncharacterized protein n=1 Tax=Aspergillus carbonarius (strain ITEM 5010) TaxID=602072 RepID=A0A1R3R9K8_ASPC5|nr:hypothetical protein ASPCADRAFT_510362 [Aspergillus carbonarius ITEM 5010]
MNSGGGAHGLFAQIKLVLVFLGFIQTSDFIVTSVILLVAGNRQICTADLEILRFKGGIVCSDLDLGLSNFAALGGSEGLLQPLGKLPDLVLSCQEHKHSARRQLAVPSRHLAERLFDIIAIGTSGEVHGHRVLTTFCLNQRWRPLAEEVWVLREIGDAQGCRHDHEFQRLDRWVFFAHGLPQVNDTADHSNEDIGVDTPFVGFIDYDNRVLAEGKVFGDLPDQDTIGHELDCSLAGRCTLESDLIRDLLGKFSQLVAHTFRHTDCSNSARLRHSNHAWIRTVRVSITCLEKELGELRRLSGTSGSPDHNCRVIVDCFHDFLLLSNNWQPQA